MRSSNAWLPIAHSACTPSSLPASSAARSRSIRSEAAARRAEAGFARATGALAANIEKCLHVRSYIGKARSGPARVQRGGARPDPLGRLILGASFAAAARAFKHQTPAL